MATKKAVKSALVGAGFKEWSWPRGSANPVDGFSLQDREGVVALIHTGGDNHKKIFAKYAKCLNAVGFWDVTRRGTGLLIRSWAPCPSCGKNRMRKTKRGFDCSSCGSLQ